MRIFFEKNYLLSLFYAGVLIFTGRHSVYFRLFFSELRYPVPNITKNIKNVIFIDSMRSCSIQSCAFSKDIVCNNKFNRNKKYVKIISVLYIFMPRKEKM